MADHEFCLLAEYWPLALIERMFRLLMKETTPELWTQIVDAFSPGNDRFNIYCTEDIIVHMGMCRCEVVRQARSEYEIECFTSR